MSRTNMPESALLPTNTAIAKSDNRDIVDHIQRVEKKSLETLLEQELGAKYGFERVKKYRKDYFKTLNSDKEPFIPEFPITVTLELVNRCNLSCVMCYTDNHKTTKYTLSADDITNILSQAKKHSLPALLLGSGSEGLLYKGLKDVIHAGKEAGVMDMFLITNGTLLTEDLSHFLIDQGVTRLLISLDAATNETFEKVRGKPLLPQIEKNIETFLRVRQERQAQLPFLRLSFCVQDLNKHEQDAFKDKWKDKVDYIDFQVLSDFSYVSEVIKNDDVKITRLPDGFGQQKPFCHYPYSYLSVWSNGDISPCCVFYGKNLVMGNIKTDTLYDVWHGDKMKELREEFVTGDINPTCRVCLSQRENLIASNVQAFTIPAQISEEA